MAASTTIEDNYPDENAPRHRCWCNNVHIILGAKIMATLGIVICFFTITLNDYNLVSANAIFVNKPFTIASAVLVVIEIPVTFLVFRALQERREAFLIPVLVVQYLNMVRLLGALVMSVDRIYKSTYVEECKQTDFAEYLACLRTANYNWVLTYLECMLIVRLISGAAFFMWSYFVYLHCYQFLKAKNQWTRSNQLALRDSQFQPESLEDSPPPVYAETV